MYGNLVSAPSFIKVSWVNLSCVVSNEFATALQLFFFFSLSALFYLWLTFENFLLPFYPFNFMIVIFFLSYFFLARKFFVSHFISLLKYTQNHLGCHAILQTWHKLIEQIWPVCLGRYSSCCPNHWALKRIWWERRWGEDLVTLKACVSHVKSCTLEARVGNRNLLCRPHLARGHWVWHVC